MPFHIFFLSKLKFRVHGSILSVDQKVFGKFSKFIGYFSCPKVCHTCPKMLTGGQIIKHL